jgi:preprotein translocase subunit SecF
MFRILHDTSYDFIKYWKHAVIATIAFIVVGFAFMGYHKVRTGRAVNYSIEFTGGTLVQLKFATAPGADAVRGAVDAAGFHSAEITEFGSPTEYTVRAQVVSGEGAANVDSAGVQIKRALEQRLGAANTVQIQRTESVGARVGQELQSKALIALLISFAVTLIYLAFRFEWRFGAAAVAATAHDLITTLAFLSMLHLEVSLTVVAALLTVVGYSLNDTIIIFDRVRENLRKARKESLRDVLNRSINETLPRSILTHATTLAATLALLVFAGEVIRPFSWIMAFGIFTGTFSSIYVAGALLLWIERKWPRDSGETKGTQRALAEGRRRERSDAAPVGTP